MARQTNRTCCICSKQYSYCPNCAEDSLKPIYLTSFCSENCKNIYTACARYNAKQINKKEAKTLLSRCDISDFNNYTDSTQRIIKEINRSNRTKKNTESDSMA